MQKQIIHIFGASGAGTSTLGRYISKKTGYYFMDTDDYYWKKTDPPYTTKRDTTDIIKLMIHDIERNKNIILSGSLVDWGDIFIPYFTLAVRIDTDTQTRIERLKRREKKNFGVRVEKGGDMHQHFLDFISWAASYDYGDLNMRSRMKHDEWQKMLQCPLIVLDGSESLEKNYMLIMRQRGESI